MPLYEVVILEEPTKKEVEDEGKQERLVFGPQAVVAKDEQSAGVAAVLDCDNEVKIDKTKMRILIRPFV
ncbi:MAG: hypothetical protein ACTSYH_03685 [Candidatus Heimdallarchaeaceae archaeon]